MSETHLVVNVCFEHNTILLDGEWTLILNGNVEEILLTIRNAKGVETPCPICRFSREDSSTQ